MNHFDSGSLINITKMNKQARLSLQMPLQSETAVYGSHTLVPAQISDTMIAAEELKSKYLDKKMGFAAFLFDKINNLTGLGINSHKSLQKLKDYQEGKASKEETEKYLKQYQYNKRESNEVTADVLTGLASFKAFQTISKLGIIGEVFKNGTKHSAKLAGIGAAVVTGMVLKPIIKCLNTIGIKKEDRKSERTRFRDFITGMMDGALAPLTLLKGAVAGIPLVIGANSVFRYLFTQKDDKSLKDYFSQQIQGAGLKIAGAGLFVLAVVNGKRNLKGWESALTRTKENLKNLKAFPEINQMSEFDELVQHIKLFENKKLFNILADTNLSNTEKMRELEKYNIFVPKFLQTIPDSAAPAELKEIISKFKSDCPVSRTVKEAQDIVSKTFGDKYIITGEKALGTGTIAETYLAREKESGKEIVIKMIKDGMSAEKLELDRKNILALLRQNKELNKDKLTYLEKRVDVLFDAWSKELNLKLESDAAVILGKNARNYNVINPIEVVDNLYVMEKASGVQFNQFVEYFKNKGEKITRQRRDTLLMNYMKVYFEQLLSVPKKGMKVMHADPHPGNVFIDINNKDKLLTFIDTGNVLRYTPKEAITNTINHLDYVIGNSNGIARSMLRGAILPEGMTQKEAAGILTKALNENIFNCKTALGTQDFFGSVNSFCEKIMAEHKIVSNPNNTNLLKAELTYLKNMDSLRHIQDIVEQNNHTLNAEDTKALQKQGRTLLKEIGQSLFNSVINNKCHTFSELRSRLKYISENKEQFLSTIKSICEF